MEKDLVTFVISLHVSRVRFKKLPLDNSSPFSRPFLNLWWQLFLRDLRARYKQTVLGVLWGLGRPVLELVVFAIVFGQVLRVPSDDAPYPLFVYTGIVMWTFVAGALPRATESLVNHAGLVANLPFPKATVPLAAAGAALFDALLAGSLLTIAMIFYRAPVTWHVLWLAPITVVLVGLVVALSLILSALNVFYRDIRHFVELGVRILFFLTPVVYASSAVPDNLISWYSLNPLVALFDAFRAALIGARTPHLGSLLYPALVTTALLLTAYLLFTRTEPYFAESV